MVAVSRIYHFYQRIRGIGFTGCMGAYEKRRLGIFNQINFTGLLTGILIPVAGLFNEGYLPLLAWVVAIAPAVVSGAVLLCNHYKKYQWAMACYFFCYPFITALIYYGKIDVGIELLFVLYSVLAFFFLQRIIQIAAVVFLCISLYLAVFVFFEGYDFVMKDINFPFYCFNQFLCIALIFLGLFLIKKENTGYRKEMEQTNLELQATNTAIKKQQDEIAEKASLLETQAVQLTQLNSVKDRLFSIISHDLRTPVYSLKNLFQSVEQYDLPGDEIKVLVPDIIKDLNYAATLMDNLLHWAKNQMQGTQVNQQLIEVKELLESTQHLARLQAAHKNITIHTQAHSGSYIYADPDMMNLVLRNLLSNAIKFTAPNGQIAIGSKLNNDDIEIFVQDNGAGIRKENINKLFSNSYFTTNGTADEKGTGLGLMLCKEFVEKNGGNISVSSEFGKGTTFTCTLPKA